MVRVNSTFATDKKAITIKLFSDFSTETYLVGTHWKRLDEILNEHFT